LREHHAVGPRRFGGAQDGAQVPRVLHAVEDDEERGVARLLEQRLEADHRLGGDDRDDPLVGDAAGHAVEGLARLEPQGHAHLAGAGDGLGDAAVADALDDEQAVEVAGPRGQGLQDGVDAANQVHGVSPGWAALSSTVACAAIPSPRPTAPSPSVLLALTETAS